MAYEAPKMKALPLDEADLLSTSGEIEAEQGEGLTRDVFATPYGRRF